MLFARPYHAWTPGPRQGVQRRRGIVAAPLLPPVHVITSRPLNIRILSPLCVKSPPSPSGICRPSSRFASSPIPLRSEPSLPLFFLSGFWLAPWFIGPRNSSYDGRNPREKVLGRALKGRRLWTGNKVMEAMSVLLHSQCSFVRSMVGGSNDRRRSIALSV